MSEEKSVLRPAEENPYYCLATLYGEDRAKSGLNRLAWNRWMADGLNEERRAEVLKQGFMEGELASFGPLELAEVIDRFRTRLGNVDATLPKRDQIDFSRTKFQTIDFFKFLFVSPVTFTDSVFSKDAHFTFASFLEGSVFDRSHFLARARFEGTTFLKDASFAHSAFEEASFRESCFKAKGSFNKARFKDNADFSHCTMSVADFRDCAFLGQAYFEEATFEQGTQFDSVTFSGKVYFTQTVFSESVGFTKTCFKSDARFGEGVFKNFVFFDMASFQSAAFFEGADFKDLATFHGTRFESDAIFDKVTFNRPIFAGTEFSAKADFIGAKFEGRTRFSSTHFKSVVPDFRGAVFHAATEWEDVIWPPPPFGMARMPQDIRLARLQLYNYQRLKQEMESLKKHEDELKFFCKELRAKRGTLEPLSPEWCFNAAFEALSDYGQSLLIPLCWLVLLFAGSAAFFATIAVVDTVPLPINDAVSLSFANIFSFLSLKRDFFDAKMLAQFSRPALYISAVESVVSVILLFLFGLALRNRFRIK